MAFRSLATTNLNARSSTHPGSEELEANAPGGMTPGPLVIGCTMIDMHVSTKMDEKFKVSSWLVASIYFMLSRGKQSD